MQPDPSATAVPRRLEWAYQARVSDLNPGGHVDNVQILRAVDEGRARLFGVREPGGAVILPGLLAAAEARVIPLVGGHRIDYLHELWYAADPLAVSLWVCRVGGSSLDVAAEVRQSPGAPVAALAVTSVVLVDLDTQAPWTITEPVREALAAYLGAPPTLRAASGGDR